MRLAIIYRPKATAPMEVALMLMGGLGQWAETYAERFSTFEFFVDGGGLVLGDFDDNAELQQILAENPFTPYSDVQIRPVIEPGVAMATYSRTLAALAAAGHPAG